MLSIKDLTLEEKLTLLTGKDAWCLNDLDGKLPKVRMADGPNGLRKVVNGVTQNAVAMPNGCLLANSWDRDAVKLNSHALAEEAIEKEVDILLGPGINIKRTPICGRNFEYFSEDPYQSGEISKAYIEGLQEKGVGACVKHFCANNREIPRCYQGSDVDERTLMEIYCKSFENSFEAKPYMVMCSYNPINGIYASENKKMLTDVLRNQLKYDGVMVSDWGAVHNHYKSVKAGLDLRMPCTPDLDQLLEAYNKGLITDQEIDTCVQRILNLMEKVERDQKTRKVTTTTEQRHDIAVEVAKQGIVLLKNDGILPLKQGSYTLRGEVIKRPPLTGGGSGKVFTDYEVRGLDVELQEKMPNSTFKFRANNRPNHGYIDSYNSSATIIGVTGVGEAEGGDRFTIKISDYDQKMILDTAKYNDNIVVLVYAGSAIDMSAWIDKVKAVIFVGFAGEGVHQALASILTGETCPSGKLAETFPRCIEDTFVGLRTANYFAERYDDGIYVGYRYFDEKGITPLFPFGYGLSYATFEYSNLKVEKLGETDYIISYDIENTSNIDAKEVSQVYVRDVFAMVHRPVKELKGFSKDLIPAHGKKTVIVKLDKSAFAYYSVNIADWFVENGSFEILVGTNASDLRLKARIDIELDDLTQQSKI